ncbi:MAG: hypothetical protein H6978_00950 [Gammaproteobacteria bacterium]|nr:hypothetical protein [Gammaproteobacteria bacterium]
MAPVAPGGLYPAPNSTAEIFQVHKVIEQIGQAYCFETYHSQRPPPAPGSLWYHRGWWLPEALDAARDGAATWVREYYPDDGSEELCLFTFTAIAAHAAHAEGYRSHYGWVTVEAYNAFIRDDIYRLRRD